MEILFTQDSQWLKKWNAFIANEDKGSHLLLSDWIKSYQSYGFANEFCIAVEDGKIIGGYASVIAKAAIFKFYIVPFGPIVAKGFEHQLDNLIATVPQRGKFHNAAYAHIALPVSEKKSTHTYCDLPEMRSLAEAKQGHLFKYVYSSNGLNWVSTQGFLEEESLLESFKSSVRRDIRSSIRKDLSMKLLESEAEIKSGYDLCLQNATKNGYALRDWDSFRATLLSIVENRAAKFIAAYKDNDMKAAILLVKAGNFYTYILGGSKKEKPDLLAGHFLQWQAIKLSLAEKTDGYNISLGGSKGVVEFKNSFNTEQFLFADSKFHWILRPALFKTYLFVEKRLKPHKQLISNALSKLRKRK